MPTTASPGLAHQQARPGRANQAAMVALAGLVLVAGLGWFAMGIKDVALIDRDEPMIAEVARQMVVRGEWLTPHLPAWEDKSIFKPPLAMWVMAGSFKVFGVSEFAARLPSAVCAALTATLLFAAAGRRWGIAAGLVAAACMVVPVLPTIVGHMAVTDSLLTLLGTIILLCLERNLRLGESRPCSAALWLAAGAGMLIKGPAILAFLGPALVIAADRFRWKRYAVFVAGMVLLVLAGRLGLGQRQPAALAAAAAGSLAVGYCMLRWAVPLLRLPVGLAWGVPLMLVSCGWWFVYVSTTSAAHAASAQRFILFEVLTRIAQPMESHSGPPGFYLAVLAGGLLPFTAVLVPLAEWSWRKGSRDRRRGETADEETGRQADQEQRQDTPARSMAADNAAMAPGGAPNTAVHRSYMSHGSYTPHPMPANTAGVAPAPAEGSRVTRGLLWAWAIGSWCLCEIASTKLPHYILPAVPALALLAAMWWRYAEDGSAPLPRWRAIGLVLPVLLMAAGIGMVTLVAWHQGLRIWLADELLEGKPEIAGRVAYLARLEAWQAGGMLLAVLMLAATCVAAGRIARSRGLRAGLAWLTMGWTPAMLVLLATVTAATPINESLSRQAARMAISMGDGQTRYYAVGFTEPALFFYLPADRYRRVARAAMLADLVRLDEPFVLIASRSFETAIRQAFGDRVERSDVATGVNTAKGRPETALVLRIGIGRH